MVKVDGAVPMQLCQFTGLYLTTSHCAWWLKVVSNELEVG